MEGLQVNFSGRCIVTLNNAKCKQFLISDQRTSILQTLAYEISDFLGGNKKALLISSAPEPSDIIYSNMGSEKLTRWKKQSLVTLVVVLLIIIDFLTLTLSKKFVKE